MKLRSGKVIPSGVSELPKELEDELQVHLQAFKEAVSTNPKHGKELLYVVSKAEGTGHRFLIRPKIYEAYDSNDIKATIPLQAAAGTLAWFLVSHPEHRYLIQSQMENFDIETSLSGEMEYNNE